MELNLSQIARPVMKVTLPDEAETVVHILSPVKYKAEQALKRFPNLFQGAVTMQEIRSFAAQLLSDNREGVVFDEAYCEKYLSDDDIGTFLLSYSRFVKGIETEKN